MRHLLAPAWVFLVLGAVLVAGACSSSEPSAPASPPGVHAEEALAAAATPAPAPTPVASNAQGTDPAVGEVAPFDVDGNVIHVHNTLCATSRSAMGPDTVGRFISRVQYVGQDPRFQGRTFEFNQCCPGCIARFPALWAERADEILAFHGISRAQRPL